MGLAGMQQIHTRASGRPAFYFSHSWFLLSLGRAGFRAVLVFAAVSCVGGVVDSCKSANWAPNVEAPLKSLGFKRRWQCATPPRHRPLVGAPPPGAPSLVCPLSLLATPPPTCSRLACPGPASLFSSLSLPLARRCCCSVHALYTPCCCCRIPAPTQSSDAWLSTSSPLSPPTASPPSPFAVTPVPLPTLPCSALNHHPDSVVSASNSASATSVVLT